MSRTTPLLAVVLLAGCAATPFTGEGIAEALEAAAPALQQLALSDGGQEPSAPADVTVIFIMPNFGRPWWALPGSTFNLANKETYVVILVPELRAEPPQAP